MDNTINITSTVLCEGSNRYATSSTNWSITDPQAYEWDGVPLLKPQKHPDGTWFVENPFWNTTWYTQAAYPAIYSFSGVDCDGQISEGQVSTVQNLIVGKEPGPYIEGDLNGTTFIYGEVLNAEWSTTSWHIEIRQIDEPDLSISSVDITHQSVHDLSWVPIPDNSTFDGNIVRITATIINNSETTKTGEVQFLDSETAQSLLAFETSNTSFTLDVGQSTQVEYYWDTMGYSWDSSGNPNSKRQVHIVLTDGIDVSDRTIDVKVNPRPVFLVHGIWDDYTAWNDYVGDGGFLHLAHPDWIGFAVDTIFTGGKVLLYPGKINSIEENAELLSQYIQSRREQLNAWHVDIIAHSMGGLISRKYIQSYMPPPALDGRPVVTHLVMLGTPNLGSTCAVSFPLLSNMELRPEFVKIFNLAVSEQRGVQFSILAGNPVRVTCPVVGAQYIHLSGRGDTVVSITGAYYRVQDRGITSSCHVKLSSFWCGRGLLSSEDFSTFVKPRLAGSSITVTSQSQLSQGSTTSVPQNLGTNKFNKPEDDSLQFLLNQTVEVQPNDALDINIPVQGGSLLAMNLIGSSSIDTTCDLQ